MPTSANKTYASADPGSSANARELGGPHGGGPRGAPLRLRTGSRHGRRAPRGAPLHGGRQQQIRGSVPSLGARVLEVRIHLPPADSPSLAGFLLAVSKSRQLPRGARGPARGHGRQRRAGPSTSRQLPVVSLSGAIPVPQCLLAGRDRGCTGAPSEVGLAM